MTTFDLCVLGAGPAGYAAAMRAHDLGKRVALVERGQIGGAGIHCGALSSKTMWHLSNDYAIAKRTDRGYRSSGGVEVKYPDVIKCVETAVRERQELLEHQLARLAASGTLTRVSGAARFLTPTSIEVKAADGTLTKIDATNFLVATGSRPRIPDGIPVDGDVVVTSDGIESWKRFPDSMVVVGAGVVGCEYATCFANFGWTKINVIDRQPRILPFEDEDVAEEIARNFEASGITIHRASKLESLRIV
ncbi:MAG TPA: FAD-dependent oxidoreductase, partial [Labilithrix sp.]